MKKRLVKRGETGKDKVTLYGSCHASCSCPPSSVPNSGQLYEANHHYNEWQLSMKS